VARRHGAAAAGGMLVLALATAGSTLAVRATNAHVTAHPPAVAARSAAGVPVATTAGPATPPPARTPVATPGAGRELTSPASPATPPAPALQVVQVVNRTPPGGPTPIAPLPGAAPVLPGPSNAPAPAPALPPAPPPAAAAPYLQIAGQPFPVCTGGDCQGSFVHDSDWSPGVPSYYDAGGSIIGNRHGLDPGVEVDLLSGTSTTRYQVLGSVTVENWGIPVRRPRRPQPRCSSAASTRPTSAATRAAPPPTSPPTSSSAPWAERLPAGHGRSRTRSTRTPLSGSGSSPVMRSVYT
jgi:hypothetical protein